LDTAGGRNGVTTQYPFLAVPITVRLGADGTMLSADPLVWRLHFLAGGEAEGAVAVPGLAEIADGARRTGMRIERAIRAVDDSGDVELWAIAVPLDQEVEISITGWRDVPPPDALSRKIAVTTEALTPNVDMVLVDPDLRIVRFPLGLYPNSSADLVGEHIGTIFDLPVDQNGSIPLVDRLIERQSIVDETLSLAATNQQCRVNLAPQFAPDGRFVGHGGTVHLLTNAPTSNGSELPMGRQFASVLKQPLSRIVANAETIGSRLHGELQDNYADYAQDIANAARHLSELVSDMEDLEAIDRPDFSTARDRIELGDIARRVSGLLALKAADHGIAFILPAEDDTVAAIGEFRRVLQILLNLANNAIRYAPDGSIVTISMEKRGSTASISVADQGAGIAPENREKVFEKFERLGRSGDGGSGLGLYISRRLARAMNGDLVVETAPEGGALFRLTLPAR
jgi:hypothetical protein